jgi:hypothetical protein
LVSAHRSTLPGIDANDRRKTMATYAFYAGKPIYVGTNLPMQAKLTLCSSFHGRRAALFSHVPLFDASGVPAENEGKRRKQREVRWPRPDTRNPYVAELTFRHRPVPRKPMPTRLRRTPRQSFPSGASSCWRLSSRCCAIKTSPATNTTTRPSGAFSRCYLCAALPPPNKAPN